MFTKIIWNVQKYLFYVFTKAGYIQANIQFLFISFFSSILYSSDLSAPVCAFYRIIREIYSRKTLILGKTIESFQESDLKKQDI